MDLGLKKVMRVNVLGVTFPKSEVVQTAAG